jgi:hypothetical protein
LTPIVVGIHGPLRSGKDTFARCLIENYGFTRLGFADGLKAEVMQRFQRTLRAYVRAGYPATPANLIDQSVWTLIYADRDPFTRALLQEYGTEVRRADNPDYWVDRWLDSVRAAFHEGCPRIVAPDVRFLNEADAIRNLKGYLVKINSRRMDPMGLSPHASENPLQGPWHFVAANTGGVADLQEEAETFAKGVLKL